MAGCCGVLIANPTAGRGRTQHLADALTARLAAAGLRLELRLTPDALAAQSAARAAVTAGADRVIVAGGDGTISSVIGALVNTPTALGIIPTGTANVLARELGIPRSWPAACDLAAGALRRTIDAGRAGDHPFVLMAGFGFDAEVVARLDPRLKRWFGPAAYVLAGVQYAAQAPPADFTLRGDAGEVTVPAAMVVVANAARYTYDWKLAPQARIDDGVLDVAVFGLRGGFDLGTHVVNVLASRPGAHPEVAFFRTRRLEVDCHPPVQMQSDGDVAGSTPLTVEVLPGALTVIAPDAPTTAKAPPHA